MFHFEINPSAFLSGESYTALILASIIFIVIPLILAVSEYRITKREKKKGLYLLIAVFASAVLLGVFSIFLGILLTLIYFIASHSKSDSANAKDKL